MELMNNVHDKMRGMSDGVLDRLDEIQPNPIGTNQRSPQERKSMFDALLAMEPEEQQRTLQIIAPLMGHKGVDFDECELCEFIKEMTGAGTLNGRADKSDNRDGHEQINTGFKPSDGSAGRSSRTE